MSTDHALSHYMKNVKFSERILPSWKQVRLNEPELSPPCSKAAFPYVCAGKAWVLMAGFTLSFGSMFSKTWRVHSIFTNVQLNKKVVSDLGLLYIKYLYCFNVVSYVTYSVV